MIFSISNQGGRKANEDNFFASQFVKAGGGLDFSDSIVALCVCDGMGGQAAGRFFSWYAARTIYSFDLGGSEKYIGSSIYALHQELVEINRNYIRKGKFPDVEGFEWSLSDQVRLAGQYENGKKPPEGGTTCTLVIINGSDRVLTVYNIGDSRAYLLGGSNMSQLTRDDTTPAGPNGRKSSQLTKCMGISTSYMGTDSNWRDAVTVSHFGLNNYDQGVLVCSDGFYNRMSTSKFYQDFTDLGPESAATKNLEYVYGRGEKDNATAAIWDVRDGV